MNPVGNTIGWCDLTWNPVTGCLNEGECRKFCFNRPIFRRFGRTAKEKDFQPLFHADRLNEPKNRKKPARIFVCCAGELFGPWVPDLWIEQVLLAAGHANWHTYMYLTKYPKRMREFSFQSYEWAGVTVSRNVDLWRIGQLQRVHAYTRFVSFEPLLEEIKLHDDRTLDHIDWIILGGLTGSRRFEPPLGWVCQLEAEARTKGIALYEKKNLRLPGPVQQWPDDYARRSE